MGETENVGFNARVRRNLGLDFVTKTAQITAKTSASLQLSVDDMLTHVNFPTFATGWYDDDHIHKNLDSRTN